MSGGEEHGEGNLAPPADEWDVKLKNKKVSRNPLTLSAKCAIMYMKRGRTPHKPERVTTMKKATLSTIYSALLDSGYESTDPIMEEISKELNKGAEKKAQNAEAYESIHDLLIGTLSETPIPFGEIFAALEADLPMGMTKGKVQYALTHLWQDEIVVVKGNPNTYRKA